MLPQWDSNPNYHRESQTLPCESKTLLALVALQFKADINSAGCSPSKNLAIRTVLPQRGSNPCRLYLFVYLFICLFVYLFVCLFIYLFVCLFIYLIKVRCMTKMIWTSVLLLPLASLKLECDLGKGESWKTWILKIAQLTYECHREWRVQISSRYRSSFGRSSWDRQTYTCNFCFILQIIQEISPNKVDIWISEATTSNHWNDKM